MLSHSRSVRKIWVSLNECEQLLWFFSLGCYDHGSVGELLWLHGCTCFMKAIVPKCHILGKFKIPMTEIGPSPTLWMVHSLKCFNM